MENEVELFQSGMKKIAILSDAGGTGISLHNVLSKTVYRVHIFLELPWSSEKIIQQMGRTHRMSKFLTKAVLGYKKSFNSSLNCLPLSNRGDSIYEMCDTFPKSFLLLQNN